MINRIIKIILLFILTTSPVWAGDIGDTVYSIQLGINDSVSKWIPGLQTVAEYLLISFASISMVWNASMMALRGADLQEFVIEVVKIIMVVGFFMFAIWNAPWLSTEIVDGWIDVAGLANGTVETPNIAKILERGPELAGLIFEKVTLKTAVPFAILAVIVAVLYTIIAAHTFFVMCELYIVAASSVVLLGFGGSQWTIDYARRYFTYLIAVGMKLYVIYLLIGFGNKFIYDWSSTVNYSEFSSVAALMSIVGMLMLLIIKVPDSVAAMVTGASLGSATPSMTKMMQTAGSAALGAVAGAAGAGMAVYEAHKLAGMSGSGASSGGGASAASSSGGGGSGAASGFDGADAGDGQSFLGGSGNGGGGSSTGLGSSLMPLPTGAQNVRPAGAAAHAARAVAGSAPGQAVGSAVAGARQRAGALSPAESMAADALMSKVAHVGRMGKHLGGAAARTVGGMVMGEYNASHGTFGGSMAQKMRADRLGGGTGGGDHSYTGGADPSGPAAGGGSAPQGGNMGGSIGPAGQGGTGNASGGDGTTGAGLTTRGTGAAGSMPGATDRGSGVASGSGQSPASSGFSAMDSGETSSSSSSATSAGSAQAGSSSGAAGGASSTAGGRSTSSSGNTASASTGGTALSGATGAVTGAANAGGVNGPGSGSRSAGGGQAPGRGAGSSSYPGSAASVVSSGSGGRVAGSGEFDVSAAGSAGQGSTTKGMGADFGGPQSDGSGSGYADDLQRMQQERATAPGYQDDLERIQQDAEKDRGRYVSGAVDLTQPGVARGGFIPGEPSIKDKLAEMRKRNPFFIGFEKRGDK